MASKQCNSCWLGPAHTINALSTEQWAWLAGYIDGEGSFIAKGKSQIVVKVDSTDLDVIQGICDLVGVGQATALAKRQTHHKRVWRWAVTRKEVALQLSIALYPWMSERRKTQIEKLDGFELGKTEMLEFETLPHQVRVAWLAGHLEGEGTFGSKSVATGSTDKDIIDRVAAICSTRFTRYVQEPPSDRPKWRPMHRIVVSRSSSVCKILEGVIPWLYERRRRAAEMLYRKARIREENAKRIGVNPKAIGVARRCPRCGETYVPHRKGMTYCKGCIYLKQRKECPQCGRWMHRSSTRCSRCRGSGKQATRIGGDYFERPTDPIVECTVGGHHASPNLS